MRRVDLLPRRSAPSLGGTPPARPPAGVRATVHAPGPEAAAVPGSVLQAPRPGFGDGAGTVAGPAGAPAMAAPRPLPLSSRAAKRTVSGRSSGERRKAVSARGTASTAPTPSHQDTHRVLAGESAADQGARSGRLGAELRGGAVAGRGRERVEGGQRPARIGAVGVGDGAGLDGGALQCQGMGVGDVGAVPGQAYQRVQGQGRQPDRGRPVGGSGTVGARRRGPRPRRCARRCR